MAGKEKGKASVKDDRFASVEFDPRFQRFPRAKSKIRVDERFKEMFENPAFQVGSTKDKRGRKKKKKKQQVDEVKRYYRLDSEEDTKHATGEQPGDLQKEKTITKKERHVTPCSSSKELSEIDEAEERWARIRGLAGPSSSDESESESMEEQDDEPDSVLDEDIETLYEEWGVGAYAANPNEQVPLFPDATARLACLDLDWANVRAVDILVALKSFIPKGGRILSVTVYPSDYGLEQMRAESTAGPRGIWNTNTSKLRNDGDKEEEDDEGELDTNKLRHYERSKLRWYYAIVICDSAKTANEIYNECDGMELMKSANRFDLRFVPEGETFSDRVVRDMATEVPVDYAAPVFQTKALQHTNVDLTWDKGDDGRKKTLTRKLKEEELKDEDFRTYLASDSEESDGANEETDPLATDDPEKIKERYKNLLVQAEDEKAMERKGVKDWGNDQEDDDSLPPGCIKDRDMELQVTFGQGLDTLGERLVAKHIEKQKTGSETVWESYLRRKREKRMEAKKKGKTRYHSSDEEESDLEPDNQPLTDTTQADDDPFNDPFFLENDTFKDSSKKRNQTIKGKLPSSSKEESDQNKRAELEMLLMDESRLQSNNNVNLSMDSQGKTISNGTKMSRKERLKLQKAKKRADREDGSDNEDLQVNGDFLNMNDPRFQAVFQSEDFALDPTDPRFIKAGPSASKMAKEAAKRRSTKRPIAISSTDQVTMPTSSNKKAKDAELKLMVASLKRKTKLEAGKDSLKRKKLQES